jgi:hypothetical protein
MNPQLEDLPVLQAALRTRITEPARLAQMLGMPIDAVRASLDRLFVAGLIVRTADGRAALPPPQQPLLDAALAQLDSQSDALARIRAALETMPVRLRRWVGAQAGEQAEVRMELSHGPDAIIDAWWRLCEQDGAVDVFGCFPDAASLTRVAAQDAGGDTAPGSRIRIIAGRTGMNAESVAAVALLQLRGADVRTLERAPGWFAGEGGTRSAFPTAWGVSWPLSVRLLPDPIAALSLRSLFDELWRRAAPLHELPIDEEPAAWEPVLRLLERGHSDAEVARALGMSERTVRRRTEEAMLDLGAVDRFTLGRAWAARR